ncbi:MAG: O-antigen ligase family protein [Flavobacteriales bacterium]|nr:O-antigen ligase family protein [Flavobacteriales bacterium]
MAAMVAVIVAKWVVAQPNFSKTTKLVLFSFSLFIDLVILDIFRTDNLSSYFSELLLKLPLIIIPLYLIFIGQATRQFRIFLQLLSFLVLVISVFSSVNYFFHYQEINQLLLQSKHVPLIIKMHHIYFGIYMAICIWLHFMFFTETKQKLWLIMGVLQIITLHILVSRTGLVAFYVSIIFYLIYSSVRNKNLKLLLGGSMALFILIAGAYAGSKSFRNKIANSVEDFEAIRTGEDINYKSMAMRLESLKTGIDVFKNKPLWGVGFEHFPEEIKNQYQRNKTKLYEINWVAPHNQFVESAATYGIFGLLVALLSVFVMVWLNAKNPLTLSVLVVILVSFMLESVIERQQGIIIYTLFGFGLCQYSVFRQKQTDI